MGLWIMVAVTAGILGLVLGGMLAWNECKKEIAEMEREVWAARRERHMRVHPSVPRAAHDWERDGTRDEA